MVRASRGVVCIIRGRPGIYQGALSLQRIPENASALFTNEHDKFVRFVRDACEGNLQSHPVAGATPQQSAVFCSCYANALADGLSTRELGVALTSQNAMSPELRRKVLVAAPLCRKQAFGHD